MQFISAVFRLFKMLFTLAQYTITALVFTLNSLRIVCKLACVGFPWFIFTSVALLLILSRYFKLKRPVKKNVDNILGVEIDGVNYSEAIDYWPIANRGASLDALENSATAIKKCAMNNCYKVLADLEITKCGELIVFHNRMLNRIGRKLKEVIQPATISSMSLAEIRKLDITENHPLGEKYEPESILSFSELIQILKFHESLTLFLLIAPRNKVVVDKLLQILQKDETTATIANRIVFCSRSPYIIYQLRKINQELICGLWIDKVTKTNLPNFLRNSALFLSIFGTFYRNVIAFVLGISVVFLHKHEYNAHLGHLWKHVGVRPIVYTLNSPNEKRYFQTVLKTQYLTDSLRSEPHHFVKVKKT